MNTTSNVKFIQGTDVINTYLADVRKYDVLTDEEEKELLEKCKNGDKEACDKLILHNLRYVYSQAKIYAKNEEDIMDYVQVGNIGLMEALSEFDFDRPTKFLTFARWYVQRNMNEYMNTDHDIIKKSNQTKYGKKIERIKAEFYNKECRYPTANEIMDIMQEKYGEEIKDIRDVYDMCVNSINMNVDDDLTVEDTSEFAEKTASYNEYDVACDKEYDSESSDMAAKLLSVLPSKHSDVIKKYYGILGPAYSIEELAEEYNMTPSTMQKIIDKSIQYMKVNAESIVGREAM